MCVEKAIASMINTIFFKFERYTRGVCVDVQLRIQDWVFVSPLRGIVIIIRCSCSGICKHVSFPWTYVHAMCIAAHVPCSSLHCWDNFCNVHPSWNAFLIGYECSDEWENALVGSCTSRFKSGALLQHCWSRCSIEAASCQVSSNPGHLRVLF